MKGKRIDFEVIASKSAIIEANGMKEIQFRGQESSYDEAQKLYLTRKPVYNLEILTIESANA